MSHQKWSSLGAIRINGLTTSEDEDVPRSTLWLANPAQEQELHCYRDIVPCAWKRREHRHLQPRKYIAPSTAADRTAATTRGVQQHLRESPLPKFFLPELQGFS